MLNSDQMSPCLASARIAPNPMLIAGLKTVAFKCWRIKIETRILKTVTKEAWHCATVEIFIQKLPSPEEKAKMEQMAGFAPRQACN
jgi:hypothetical protein